MLVCQFEAKSVGAALKLNGSSILSDWKVAGSTPVKVTPTDGFKFITRLLIKQAVQ